MNMYIKFLMMTSVMCGGVSVAQAQTNDSPFSFSANAGYEFDSNLTVDSIDSTSNVGDQALIFDASLNYDFVNNDKVSFSAGYDYYQSIHNDLDEFDMIIHGFNADSRYSIDRIDLGLAYLFNTIGLGGDSFLDMHTVRPSVGYLTGANNVYLLGAYEYQKQTFKLASLMSRNASRNSGSIKAIILLGEGRTFTAGYTYSLHDTADDAYRYNGHTVDFSVKLPLDIIDRETIVRMGYRLQSRGYDVASLTIDTVIRSDKRHTLSVSWEVPFGNGFNGKLSNEYIASNSTFEPVDYNENITTINVGWEF